MVIDDAIDGRGDGAVGINNDGDWVGRLAFVAGRVFDHHDDLMGTVFQLWVRGEFPATVVAHNGAADFGAVVDDDDGIARHCAAAAEGRGFVVGGVAVADAALDRADVVGDVFDAARAYARFARCGGVNNDGDWVGRLAFVAGRVLDHHDDVMRALFQLWVRGEFPTTVFIHNNAADFFAVVDDDDGIARHCAAAAEGRGFVVGGVAVADAALDRADVVGDVFDAARAYARFARCGGVNNDGDWVGRLAFVAVWIADHDLDFMSPLFQHRVRGEFPTTVVAHNSAADFFAVVDDHDDIARPCAAAGEGRGFVVGGVAIADAALDRADVVGDVFDAARAYARFARCGGVNNDGDWVGRLAFVAGRVLDHHDDVMGTVFQLRVRGEFPTTIVAHNGAADFFAAVDDDDGVARRCAAAGEGRGFVVGGVAVADTALDRADVVDDVVDATVTDAWFFRGRDVDDDREWLRRGADVTGSVFGGDGELVRAGFQCGFRGEAPLAVDIGQHAADFHAVVEDAHDGARFSATAEGRGGVVGAVAGGEGACLRVDVIDDALDPRGARCHGVHDDFVARGWLTFVAVRVDRNHHDDVGTVIQARRGWGEFPLAVFADNGGADSFAVVDDFNAAAWTADTGEGRGFVVGGTTVFNQALLVAHVIVSAADRTFVAVGAAGFIFLVVITGSRINATQQAQGAEAQQGRPEPTNAVAGHQAIGKTGQWLSTQHLWRFNAFVQERRRAVLVTVGGDVRVVRTVFGNTDQLAATAFKIFDDQLRLIRVSAFERDVQVFAHTLDGDVFRGDPFFTFSQDVFATLYRFDAHRKTGFGGTEVHRLGNRLAVYDGDIH